MKLSKYGRSSASFSRYEIALLDSITGGVGSHIAMTVKQRNEAYASLKSKIARMKHVSGMCPDLPRRVTLKERIREQLAAGVETVAEMSRILSKPPQHIRRDLFDMRMTGEVEKHARGHFRFTQKNDERSAA